MKLFSLNKYTLYLNQIQYFNQILHIFIKKQLKYKKKMNG